MIEHALRRGEIHLIYSPLQADSDLLATLRQTLSSDERERADRFRFERHRNAFMVARGLLRVILGAYLGVEATAIPFVYGAHGKPAVAHAQPLRFNVSHSENAVLYGLSCADEIGVDIEFIRPLEHLADIARRFFCPAEYHQLLQLPEEQRVPAFFRCWTRKEAFIKAVGEGLSYPLDRFQVTLRPGEPARFVSINDRPGSETAWSLQDVSPSPTYAAAVAVEGPESRFFTWRFDSPRQCARFFER